MFLLASALAAPPVPTLARGEKLELVATLEQCTVHVAARARGRRKVALLGPREEPIAEGRGAVTWAGPPPMGSGQYGRDHVTYDAVAGRHRRSVQVDFVAPVLGPFTVDGAPVASGVEGWADIAPVVTLTVEHPCPELLTFHVTGPEGLAMEVQPVDGALHIPLAEGTGTVFVETRWSGHEVGDRRSFWMHVRGPRPCIDDDGDGLSDCDGDCHDGDARQHPGFPEVPWDGVDNNCDGVQAGDADGDGLDAARHVPRVDVGGMGKLEALYGPIRARRVARELMDPELGISESRYFDCDDTDPAVGRDAEIDPWDERCAIARPGPRDDDGDGFARECADDDPTRHPGAVEVRNGFDDDCDGRIDEGVAIPDADDTSARAPGWLGVIDVPTAHRFVLSDRDVDAYTFAVRPPREGATSWIEVDAGGGAWHGSLYGAPATELAGGLHFLTNAYGSTAQVAVFRGGGGGGGSLLGLTLKVLDVLPFEAAVPVGVLLLPAAVGAELTRPGSDASPPTPPGDAVLPSPVAAPLPADAYVYLLVLTRDRGPGGLAELNVREVGR